MGRRRAHRWLLLFWAVVAICAGCASVPSSGGFEVGEEGQRDAIQDPDTSLRLPGPKPGATVEDIVRNFAEAMYSYEAGYIAARQFLTESAAATWDPSIIEISRYKIDVNLEKLKLTYTVTGKVVDNVYFDVPDEEREIAVAPTLVDGELRITNPPDGMVMSELDFDREFARYNRYFWDPSYEFLVPDPVYLPTGNSSKIQTLLANALLDGPSESLEPGVRTAFPQGTTLSGNTAPIDKSTSIASVDLSDDAAQATSGERKQMAAQLAWTLSEVAGVVGVEATAGGSLLYQDDPMRRESFANVDASELAGVPNAPLYGVTSNGLEMLDFEEEEPSPVPGALGTMSDLADVAVDPRSEQAAVVDRAGEQVLMAGLEEGSESRAIYAGTAVSSLAWDPMGVIWALDADDGSTRVVAMTPQGENVPVEITGLDEQQVESLAVSPDGTRLALVIDGVAEIRTIVRANGVSGPIEALHPRAVRESVADVAWYDGTSLAMLRDVAGQPPQPVVAGLTRESWQFEPDWEEFEPLDEEVTSIAASSVQAGRTVIVASDDGSVYELSDDGSVRELPSMVDPSYPG